MHFLPCHNIQCSDLKSVTRANTLKILNVQTISEYCGPLFQTVLNMAAMSACPACRWRRRCSWRWPWVYPPRPDSAGSSWSHSTFAGGLSRIYVFRLYRNILLNDSKCCVAFKTEHKQTSSKDHKVGETSSISLSVPNILQTVEWVSHIPKRNWQKYCNCEGTCDNPDD